ncbi:MAG: NADH-quinone oxidoreductase subunit N [Nitrospinota bacterium]
MFLTDSIIRLDAIAPEIVLALVAIVILMLEVFAHNRGKHLFCYVALGGVILAAAFTLLLVGKEFTTFSGHYQIDSFGLFFKIVILIGTGLTLLVSNQYLIDRGLNYGEYYALILFSVVGQFIIISGNDLMTIFLGIETMSLSLYVLTGFARGSNSSIEASAKYFVLGALAGATILYGIALIFGATATTKLNLINDALTTGAVSYNLLIGGFILLLAGLALKVSVVPFHMWVPDVYQGAPTPVTAFMASTAKVAGFALLIRILMEAFYPLWDHWSLILSILAVLTMTVGNIIALVQDNVKRMLAYSSISHVGYILIGIVVATNSSIGATAFYLLVYTFMTIGAFAILAIIADKDEQNLSFESLRGLGAKRPFLAATFAIMIFSLAGIPPTAGFVGKFYIFMAAVENDFLWLAIVGALNSVLSVFYYLKAIIFTYFKEYDTKTTLFEQSALTPIMTIALVVMIYGALVIGIIPADYIGFAKAFTIIK